MEEKIVVYHFIIANELLDFITEKKVKDEIELDRTTHNFKGFFSSIKEGFDFLLEKFSFILKENKVNKKDFLDFITITKIDTQKCPEYRNLFKEFCNF